MLLFLIFITESIAFPVTPKVDVSQKLNNSINEKDSKENGVEKGSAEKSVIKKSTPGAKKVTVCFVLIFFCFLMRMVL